MATSPRDDRTRSGFTLIELLVVMVLGVVVLGAVYQTLVIQEGTFRAQKSIASAQDVSRTALDVLVGEVREVSANATDGPGGDIAVMGPDSIRFRSFRKAAVVCGKTAGAILVYEPGDSIVAGDSVLVFSEGDPWSPDDDEWVADAVSARASSTVCPDRSGYVRASLSASTAPGLSGVRTGASVRAFEWLTYGLYQDGTGDWMLGRHASGGSVQYLVGPLAPFASGGLRLTYYDTNGAETTDPASVVRIAVSVKAASAAGRELDGQYTDSLVTQVFLRNN